MGIKPYLWLFFLLVLVGCSNSKEDEPIIKLDYLLQDYQWSAIVTEDSEPIYRVITFKNGDVNMEDYSLSGDRIKTHIRIASYSYEWTVPNKEAAIDVFPKYEDSLPFMEYWNIKPSNNSIAGMPNPFGLVLIASEQEFFYPGNILGYKKSD